MFYVLSGSAYCTTDAAGVCVTDGTGNHGNQESCVFTVTQPTVYATATYFQTETFFDYITIGGVRYSGTNGPSNVMMTQGQTFSWYADFSITYGGFTICGSATQIPMPPPTPGAPPPSPSPPPPAWSPAPPTPADYWWAIVSGSDSCYVSNSGTCVTDGVGTHANEESCQVIANRQLYATATLFDVETYFDYITLGGIRYSGNTGPQNVMMAAGDTMTWFADFSVTYACGGTERPMPLLAPIALLLAADGCCHDRLTGDCAD